MQGITQPQKSKKLLTTEYTEHAEKYSAFRVCFSSVCSAFSVVNAFDVELSRLLMQAALRRHVRRQKLHLIRQYAAVGEYQILRTIRHVG